MQCGLALKKHMGIWIYEYAYTNIWRDRKEEENASEYG